MLDLLLTKGAWVNDVAWSPSGDILCFVGHDSSIFFVYYRHMVSFLGWHFCARSSFFFLPSFNVWGDPPVCLLSTVVVAVVLSSIHPCIHCCGLQDESGMPAFQKLTLSDLPFRQVLFVSERSVIAGGDDCTPFVFVYDGSQW